MPGQLFHDSFFAVFFLCIGIALFNYPKVSVKKLGSLAKFMAIVGLVMVIGTVPMFFVVIDDICKLLN